MLIDEQVAQYRRHGFTAPLDVLTSEEAAGYRLRCQELEEALGGAPRTIEVRQMHLHLPWAHQLAVHPRVTEAVAAVLGPDLLVWATELFSKLPGDAQGQIGWHRDRPYMGFEPSLTTSAWISLGESGPHNGCMQVVLEEDRAGSTLGQGRGANKSQPGVPADCITDVVLRPGQMSLHDSDVFHGSGPNPSGEKRIGFVVRYLRPEARALSGHPPVILARGSDRAGNFQLLPAPAEVSLGQALAGMRASARQHLEGMLANLSLSQAQSRTLRGGR